MARQLFELCGKDKANRFSPFVWRARLALCRKGLSFEGIPGAFLEKDAFAPSGSKTVPVLKDGETWVSDSWDIACYLEDTYPDKPSLFGGAEGKAYSTFMMGFAATLLQPRIFLLVAPDIAESCEGEHKDYFLKTRAERIGMPVPDLVALRDKNMALFKDCLKPLNYALKMEDYFSGSEPLYPDYIVYGAFRWAKMVSPLDLLAGEEALKDWFARVDVFYRDKIPALETEPLV